MFSVIFASPVAVAALSLATGPSVSLLTTPPEVLRDHFGWPIADKVGDKCRSVWAGLRKGIDVLDDEEAAQTKYLSPRLLRQLKPECTGVAAAASLADAVASSDGTQKLLLTLKDGLSIECVLIPISGKHTSLCVSSQVGCSRACAFCSTGTMGLIRSLSTEEILVQVWYALRMVREQSLPPANILVEREVVPSKALGLRPREQQVAAVFVHAAVILEVVAQQIPIGVVLAEPIVVHRRRMPLRPVDGKDAHLGV